MQYQGILLLLGLILSPISCIADDALAQAEAAYANQDFSEAAKLLRPIAEQGNSDAQLKLGILYQFGRGVNQDYVEAMKWYREADKQGNPAAKNRIAALEERISVKKEREPMIANQPTPQSDFGAGLRNVLGSVAAGVAAANGNQSAATTYTQVNSTGSNLKYSGPYAREVDYLWSHSPAALRTPSCATCTDGTPPIVPKNLPCQRDYYYYAALAAAWAAESHAQVGNASAAVEDAKLVRDNLNKANQLCSNAPAVGRVICPSLHYWGCPGW